MTRLIFDGSEGQARQILAAMAEVARAGGRTLTDVDKAALISSSALVFALKEPLDPDSLGKVSPEQLAESLGSKGREAIVPLVVMATADGKVAPEAAERVAAYAQSLGIDEPAVRDLQALVGGQLAAARADMLRRNRASITGTWVEDISSYGGWMFPYRGSPDPGLVQRYGALGTRPVGSFGRAFHDFYRANGYGFAGLEESPAESFTTPHDSAHILSGYDTSVQGELLVSTFTAGMHRSEALAGHILPVIVSWHLGLPLAVPAGSATGALDVRKFWIAWKRGDATSGDTFNPDWDFWQHVDAPLDDLRAAMGVPRLDPADAAEAAVADGPGAIAAPTGYPASRPTAREGLDRGGG
ncbi:ubiquinone biosynthesis protein COQ4 [Cyanobium sp. Morenito 9A2]|uniref:ubiquinone biosynthesis protein COQ4 n=1 Tax=Cyanobium sp. Morenito 9A2 TaxID=2823718 RepID=UPI0020CF8848|nr:ubiquinone biosynthesis protein COQ4 [Cyanobium sp. Morenito 9A2]MCP9851184.1 hypothetical protein [Cyanobium sp. Morenito 9A2]